MLITGTFSIIQDMIRCISGIHLQYFTDAQDMWPVLKIKTDMPGCQNAILEAVRPGTVLHLKIDQRQFVIFQKFALSEIYCFGPFYAPSESDTQTPCAHAHQVLGTAARLMEEECVVKFIDFQTEQFTRYPGISDQVIKYIQENLSSKLTLQAISRHIGFSETCISHYFKRDVGIPPMQYAMQQRIQLAKRLLHTTQLPLQDIAVQVGIPDSSYFSKQFRQHTGLTPSQFRQTA